MVLDMARRGFFSDPDGIDLYEHCGNDSERNGGLPLYRCLRGTSAVEGYHAHVIRCMSTFGADPELIDAFLASHRQHWNLTVSHWALGTGAH